MRVKELEIHVRNYGGQNMKESVLKAIKNNFSLRSVKCQTTAEEIFSKPTTISSETGILRGPKRACGAMG